MSTSRVVSPRRLLTAAALGAVCTEAVTLAIFAVVMVVAPAATWSSGNVLWVLLVLGIMAAVGAALSAVAVAVFTPRAPRSVATDNGESQPQ